MRPGTIKADRLNRLEVEKFVRWFEANGVRHHVPAHARIIFTGNRLIIPTFDIERVGQTRNAWTRNQRIRFNGERRLPVKVRTYRVRVPFEAIK